MTRVDGTKVLCDIQDDTNYVLITCVKELNPPQTMHEEEDDSCLEDLITKTAAGREERSIMEVMYKYEVNSAEEQAIRSIITLQRPWRIEHPDGTKEDFDGVLLGLAPEQYVNGAQRMARLRIARNSVITYVDPV